MSEFYDPLKLAKEHPESKRRAIDAKCYDCEGQDADPGWKLRVRACVVLDCPLWPHRPYQKVRTDR